MPVQNDQGVTQGWGACKLPGKSDFVKCFIVLDRTQQRLICYKGQERKSSSQVNYASLGQQNLYIRSVSAPSSDFLDHKIKAPHA